MEPVDHQSESSPAARDDEPLTPRDLQPVRDLDSDSAGKGQAPAGKGQARGEEVQPSGPVAPMTRGDVYSRPMAAGRAVPNGLAARIGAGLRRLLTTDLQRREEQIEAQFAALPGVTHPNTISVLSPKGGVGKTTSTFLVGNLLASSMNLRVIALDANPDFGTLSALAPDAVRSPHSLADVLGEMDKLSTTAELHRFVSRLPTGLHLLGAPAHAEVMAQMTPGLYDRLLQFLRRFYEVILLDLGTGITDPIAQLAVEQADQTVVVTTPEWITAANVLGALRYLSLEQATLVLNQAPSKRHGGNREVIEANFRRQAISTRVTIPFDERLRVMLDSGSYSLEGLERPTRVAIKELGLAVGRGLV